MAVSSTDQQKFGPIVFDEPIAPNKYYAVKPVNAGNTLTVPITSFVGPLNELAACLHHGVTKLSTKPSCPHCYPFVEFPFTFLLKAKHGLYSVPPPSSFSDKSTNYFSSFLDTCKSNQDMGLHKLTRRRRTRSYKKLKGSGKAKLEHGKYENFVRSDFSGGPLANMMSGKKAFVRHKILGKNVNGVRMTLTIDSSMPPDRVSIPTSLFHKLGLATPLAIINRSPSINSRSIHVVQLMPHEDDTNDYTIKINAYVVDGMHADQDGDELHIIILKRDQEIPTREMRQAITELKKVSWAYGLRHDGFYKPRFDFSQYHRTLCSLYDKELERVSPLWASLHGLTVPKKLSAIMNLGCSLFYDLVDQFIKFLGQLIRSNKAYVGCGTLNDWGNDCVLSINDVLFRNSFLERHVVDAGAKGSKLHVQVFLRNLHSSNVDTWFDEAVAKFDHIVSSSNEMSIVGQEQFNLLYEYNGLHLTNGHVYKNSTVYLENFLDSHFGQRISYNNSAVAWALDHLDQSWDLGLRVN